MIEKYILRRIEKRAVKLNVKPSFSVGGEQLYTMAQGLDMHISRLPELYRYINYLSGSIGQSDINTIIDIMDGALNVTDGSNPKPNLTMMAATIHELKTRESLINSETVYNIIALINLTENEAKNGGKFSKVEHDYKVRLIQENDLSFFLPKSGLIPLLASLKILPKSDTDIISELEQNLLRSKEYLSKLNERRQQVIFGNTRRN